MTSSQPYHHSITTWRHGHHCIIVCMKCLTEVSKKESEFYTPNFTTWPVLPRGHRDLLCCCWYFVLFTICVYVEKMLKLSKLRSAFSSVRCFAKLCSDVASAFTLQWFIYKRYCSCWRLYSNLGGVYGYTDTLAYLMFCYFLFSWKTRLSWSS